VCVCVCVYFSFLLIWDHEYLCHFNIFVYTYKWFDIIRSVNYNVIHNKNIEENITSFIFWYFDFLNSFFSHVHNNEMNILNIYMNIKNSWQEKCFIKNHDLCDKNVILHNSNIFILCSTFMFVLCLEYIFIEAW
jgi:hypothetical protein